MILSGEHMLSNVAPELAAFVRSVAAVIDVRVTEGLRSDAVQRDYYSRGRDANGVIVDKSKVITYAPTAHDSAHGCGLAVDIQPVPTNAATWGILASMGKKAGLDWGGDFKAPDGTPFNDAPHFQIHDWIKRRDGASNVAAIGIGVVIVALFLYLAFASEGGSLNA